ncbi:phosphatidylglycerophosphatase and protein-tyrosine phosphatase 1-like [Paramacrobiotus metropolitanus]|uniref:phosphatidylglycerophosphatase and protein-tyrosine phosphatase 1-like n=1 Tax=Paramacrobiotus metropolitanus TaxID=2943436 RepID=UPI002445C268|nr:phosphatidylglycerophosphatase and protein-tyrosine phosphatase 1-like [Paramacrobiotus metropolitanus]
MSALRKALFFPTILYNIVADSITSRTWYNRIDRHLVLGAIPFRSVLEDLAPTEKIKGMISMNEDFELNPRWYPTSSELQQLGIEFLRLPVSDYTGTPTREQILQGLHFIDQVIKRDSEASIYIHCKAGRSRSAYLAAAYLMAKQQKKADEVISFLKEKRPQIWIGSQQTKSLEEYYEEAVAQPK